MEDTGESTGSIRLARRDQRSLIPHHAHAPAPSPSRRWSIRCIAFALVTDGNLGTPLAPRFRLRVGCAPLHSGLCSAIRCAPFLRSAPARQPSDRSALEPFSMTALNRRCHERFHGSRLAGEEYLQRASDRYVLGNDSFAEDNRPSRQISQPEGTNQSPNRRTLRCRQRDSFLAQDTRFINTIFARSKRSGRIASSPREMARGLQTWRLRNSRAQKRSTSHSPSDARTERQTRL